VSVNGTRKVAQVKGAGDQGALEKFKTLSA
jgi:hypothetical protein